MFHPDSWFDIATTICSAIVNQQEATQVLFFLFSFFFSLPKLISKFIK